MTHILTDERPWASDKKAEAQLGEVYRENVDYVWRALIHLGVNSSDVQDVAHDVFLTVRRRLSSFEGRSALRTWIYGICIRTVSDYRNRAFRRREIPHEQVPDTIEAPAQQAHAETSALSAKLGELLDRLNEEQRAVFVLYEIEELGMKEVAEAVGCPLQTAYSRLHAARAALKQGLVQAGYQP